MFKENGLSIVLLSLFLFALGGQAFTGWGEHNEDQQQHGRASILHAQPHRLEVQRQPLAVHAAAPEGQRAGADRKPDAALAHVERQDDRFGPRGGGRRLGVHVRQCRAAGR